MVRALDGEKNLVLKRKIVLKLQPISLRLIMEVSSGVDEDDEKREIRSLGTDYRRWKKFYEKYKLKDK